MLSPDCEFSVWLLHLVQHISSRCRQLHGAWTRSHLARWDGGSGAHSDGKPSGPSHISMNNNYCSDDIKYSTINSSSNTLYFYYINAWCYWICDRELPAAASLWSGMKHSLKLTFLLLYSIYISTIQSAKTVLYSVCWCNFYDLIK